TGSQPLRNVPGRQVADLQPALDLDEILEEAAVSLGGAGVPVLEAPGQEVVERFGHEVLLMAVVFLRGDRRIQQLPELRLDQRRRVPPSRPAALPRARDSFRVGTQAVVDASDGDA